MADDDGDKSEEPTAKRQSESRQKGQVARSTDLGSAVSLLTGAIILWSTGEFLGGKLQGLTRECFRAISRGDFTEGDLMYYTWSAAKLFALLLSPVLIVLLVVGLIVNVYQVGFVFSSYPLQPNLGKIFSPSNFSKLVSADKWVELVKSIFKMLLVGLVAYQVINSHLYEMMLMADMGLPMIVKRLIDFAIELAIKTALLLLLLGLIDLFYQKYRHHQQLKMTKQEVKDEAKMSEGDPKVRNKIRQLRAQMHQKFMMKEVPKATVVITNPTFIAIAVRYEPMRDTAPIVVAKGKRLIAERIRELARESNIPIVENKPLARGLYDIIELGEPIPQEFFAPVAEILAYVYKMDKKHLPTAA